MMNYNEFINNHILNMKPSGIRKFFSIAEEMDNVISLGVGEPDFLTPWHIRKKGIETGMKIAYDSGFRKITIYKKHQPELINIE